MSTWFKFLLSSSLQGSNVNPKSSAKHCVRPRVIPVGTFAIVCVKSIQDTRLPLIVMPLIKAAFIGSFLQEDISNKLFFECSKHVKQFLISTLINNEQNTELVNENNMNIVLDLGANVECSEKNLIDFSEMGSALFKSLFPNEKAKLSLLNIGSEEIKGTGILRSTYAKLKQLDQFGDFEFRGYIEGNHITKGDTNVIVTDGFTGNVALKTAEGTADFLTKNLKKALSENFLSKLSAIFSYFSLKNMC